MGAYLMCFFLFDLFFHVARLYLNMLDIRFCRLALLFGGHARCAFCWRLQYLLTGPRDGCQVEGH